MMGIGALAALMAAAIWAIAALLFNRVMADRAIAPLQVTLYRGLIAWPFLLVTVLIRQEPWPVLSFPQWIALIASALLGVAVGDAAFFLSLRDLGVRRALLMQTLVPPSAALLAWLFLGENLRSMNQWGMVITLGGIAWVISERNANAADGDRHRWQGAFWGGVSGLSQGLAVMLMRGVFLDTPISPLWSSTIRLALANVSLAVLLLGMGQLGSPLRDRRIWIGLAIASFLGTYLGLWLHQLAIKLAPAGIAATLLSTSPLFSLLLAIRWGDRPNGRAVGGAIVALMGIALLVLA